MWARSIAFPYPGSRPAVARKDGSTTQALSPPSPTVTQARPGGQAGRPVDHEPFITEGPHFARQVGPALPRSKQIPASPQSASEVQLFAHRLLRPCRFFARRTHFRPGQSTAKRHSPARADRARAGTTRTSGGGVASTQAPKIAATPTAAIPRRTSTIER